MKPTEVLLKAAEIMSERGHAKGSYELTEDTDRGRKGSVCAYGAMTLAVTGQSSCFAEFDCEQNWVGDLIKQAGELLAQHVELVPSFIDTPFAKVTHFNDAATTTAEDMILAMKGAAHAAE